MKRTEDTSQNSAKTMRKNNIWNRLFYRAEIKENQKKMSIYIKQRETGQSIINAIKDCDSLITLMHIHKNAWSNGFQNKDIGPDPYGMFRTSDILTMVPCEVFLGGIYGINTNPIPFWEAHKNDKYGCNEFGIDENYPLYKIVLDQYKNLLLFNIRYMLKVADLNYPYYKGCGYQNFLCPFCKRLFL